mgnify:CR=1 FL=1
MVSLVAAGDNVVDCYPQTDVMFPGGNTVNVAVNAARLGASASYIGVVGTDPAGDLVRSALEAEGVDLSRLRVVDGPNAAATVLVVDGNREFVGGDVGVSRFRLDPRDLEAVASADVVHTGECSMLEDDLVALKGAAQLLSFDFSERDMAYVETYAPLADVAILSRPDIGVQQAIQLAGAVAELGPRTVAVTMGPRGAVVHHDGDAVVGPAGDGPIVDTLGAGDAFIARLLVGLAAGEAVADLVGAATAYATATCATQGAFGYAAPLDHPAVAPSTPVTPASQSKPQTGVHA